MHSYHITGLIMSVSPTPPSYRQEYLQQILQLAIARQAHNDDFSREQLWEIAAELDISPENLQLAEQEWLSRRGELQQRQEFNLYRRRMFQKTFGTYLIVNTFLLLLNFLTSGTISWSLYILLVWGLGLCLNVWNLYQETSEEYEQAFGKWSNKNQLKRSINNILDKVNKFLPS